MGTITGTKDDDYLPGTNGADVMTGGGGDDTFGFFFDPPNGTSKRSTLDDNERITDYESGEKINIGGVRLTGKNVDVDFNKTTKNTEIKIDFDLDGKVDRTIILDGDQRGRLYVDSNCCATPDTDIYIKKGEASSTTIGAIDVTGANFVDTFMINTHEGTEGPDIFDVLEGNDTVFAQGGNDIISGGTGDDTLNGGTGDDLIGGDAGNDTLHGDDGNDQLLGFSGNDSLFGDNGNDFLRGDDGDDTMNGGSGNDLIDGGDGIDIVIYSSIYDEYLVKKTPDGRFTVTDNTLSRDGSDILLNVEKIQFQDQLFYVPPNAETSNGVYNLYRFLNTETGAHFYTASETERDNTIGNSAYSFEGNTFDSNAVQNEQGVTPVYRLFNTTTGVHFYTINENEKNSALESGNFNDEGVGYNAFSENGAGREALYRFYNPTTGTHFYTASECEKECIEADNPGLNSEGIAYYVSGVAPTAASAASVNVVGGQEVLIAEIG